MRNFTRRSSQSQWCDPKTSFISSNSTPCDPQLVVHKFTLARLKHLVTPSVYETWLPIQRTWKYKLIRVFATMRLKTDRGLYTRRWGLWSFAGRSKVFRPPNSANNDILGSTDPATHFYTPVLEPPMSLLQLNRASRCSDMLNAPLEQVPPTPSLPRQKTGYSSLTLLTTTG